MDQKPAWSAVDSAFDVRVAVSRSIWDAAERSDYRVGVSIGYLDENGVHTVSQTPAPVRLPDTTFVGLDETNAIVYLAVPASAAPGANPSYETTTQLYRRTRPFGSPVVIVFP